LDDYLDLPLTRHWHQGILPRALEMYETISAYNAIYLALAEGLGAPLLTADMRLTLGAERFGVACHGANCVGSWGASAARRKTPFPASDSSLCFRIF
jgi:hypothetical protein